MATEGEPIRPNTIWETLGRAPTQDVRASGNRAVSHRQLYVRQKTMKVGVYVGDLLMTGTKTTMINQFFKDMHALEVKNFGVVAKFLGIRVTYDPEIG